jgi:hypothetical protein
MGKRGKKSQTFWIDGHEWTIEQMAWAHGISVAAYRHRLKRGYKPLFTPERPKNPVSFLDAFVALARGDL